MNGVHDMGGMHGFGPIGYDPNEPAFHHDWERTAVAIQFAGIGSGQWRADEFRHTRESVEPAIYLGSEYYELWMESLERVMIAKGIVDEAEIDRRQAILRANPELPAKALFAGEAAPLLPQDAQWDFRRRLVTEPGFAIGDAVLTNNRQPHGHTRLPRYARAKHGIVVRYHGAFNLADASAAGEERPEHLYSVRFEAEEIWGPDADGPGAIYLDAWESYLRPD
jgi:nitrile hydratase